MHLDTVNVAACSASDCLQWGCMAKAHRFRDQVALALPNGGTGNAAHQFRGNFEHSKDDMDCVLVFDGHSFSLQALAGRINNLRSRLSTCLLAFSLCK